MNEDQTTQVVSRIPGRSRTRMAVFGTILLLCGMIIGAGAMATVLWERFQHSIRNPKRMPERIVGDMRDALGLTEAQAAQIEAIIERHRDEFEAIRAEMEPKIQAHIDQVNQEIQTVLTPEQQKEWDQHFSRERHRWAGPPGKWGGHHPPPGDRGPPGDHMPPSPPEPFPEPGGE